MKNKLTYAFALLTSTMFLASAVSSVPRADPISALASLATGDALVVHRTVTRLDVGARGDTTPVFSLTSDGIGMIRTQLPRPSEGSQASVREEQGPTGETMWRVAHTARGAKILVSGEGVLHPRGLDVLLLDNDDLVVTDGDGTLLYARRTLADGTLLEHEGIDGCDCARSTSPEGVTSLKVR